MKMLPIFLCLCVFGALVYYFLYYNKCTDNCSDNGKCVYGKCVCDSGYTGDTCDIKECKDNCSSSGNCVDGKCVCDDGYTGDTCQTKTDQCSGNGKYVDGECVCVDGYTGDTCAIKECKNKCSDNAKCVDGKCVCNDGYTGDTCGQIQCEIENTCSVGYSIQGWDSTGELGTFSAKSTADCAEQAGNKNWSFDLSKDSLNCIIGDRKNGGCVNKNTNFISDMSAINAPICDGCQLGSVLYPFGAVCNSKSDCGGEVECNKTKCSKNIDCIFTESAECDTSVGLCKKGSCDKGYCKTDTDCSGGSFPNIKCIQGECKTPAPFGFSCGMKNNFFPNVAQGIKLQTICENSSLGDKCSVDFGDDGKLEGRCGSNCDDINGDLTCWPENVCSLDDNTSLDNLQGSCIDTKSAVNICFSP